jgi:hypothetical protein
MLQSLKRTFMGPSRDPRILAYISRPLPRYLSDDDVVAALDIAFQQNPDPGYLVETLRPALLEVTGHDYEVLDRSVRDVTGAFSKTMVMIRDGDIGLWPGFAARSYPLIRSTEKTAETTAAIGGPDAPPQRKPGWEPPVPTTPQQRETIEHSAPLIGGADGEHQ